VGPLRRWDRASSIIASLCVFNDLLLSAGVSLASSSSWSCLISALAAASSSWGFETVVVSPLEVFAGPAAALPAAVFLGIVVLLGNFW